MYLCKITKAKHSEEKFTEVSKNEIEVIIFPKGFKERKGRCIGFPTDNCKFKIGTQEVINDIMQHEEERNAAPTVQLFHCHITSPNAMQTIQQEETRKFNWLGKGKIASIRKVCPRTNGTKTLSSEGTTRPPKRGNDGPGGITAEEIGNPSYQETQMKEEEAKDTPVEMPSNLSVNDSNGMHKESY